MIDNKDGALVGCAALVVLLVVAVLLRAWVMAKLWGWFVTPLGVEAIGIAHAIGLSALVTMFTASADRKAEEKPSWPNIVGRVVVAPLLALLIGFIAHRMAA